MSYEAHLLTQVLIYGLSAVGLSFLVGHIGQLSMAQAASFAVGAYAYAVVTVGYSLTPVTALGITAVVAVLFAAVQGFLARALVDDQFVFGTLAFNAVIAGLIVNSTDGSSPLGSPHNLTNGSYGISDIPPLVSGDSFGGPWSHMTVVAIIASVLLGASWVALRSPWGRLLRAIRDSSALALSLGKKVPSERARAAEVASFLGSIAGALFAAEARYLEASMASTDSSVLFLTCVLLGGAASFWGPLLGAAGVVLLPELLRLAGVGGATVASLRVVAYSTVLLLLVHLRPSGLLRGTGSNARKREAGNV